MPNTLVNFARMTTATTGAGTITLGSAVDSYLTFSDAGVSDGDVVTYSIVDGNEREIGRGTYTAAGTTLSRDTVYTSTASGSQISLTGSAQVFITPAAEDLGQIITPMMFGAAGDNSTDDTAALQAALDFMLTNQATVHTLDLMGRRYLISASLDDVEAGATGIYKKRITNGWIQATSGFTGTHLFDFTNATGDITALRFDNLTLQGSGDGVAPNCDGAIALDNTQGVWITDCTIQNFNGQIIYDVNTGAGCEVHVIACRITGGTLGTAPIGIDLAGNDNEIHLNIIRECDNHIRCRAGANQITGNHIYNFSLDPNVPGIRLDTAIRVEILNNYIDGVWVDMYDPENCVINGNKFLLQDGADWTASESNRAFIEMIPSTTGFTVDNLIVTHNSFSCLANGPVNLIRASGALSGNITGGFTSCHIRENAVDGVNEQATHYQRRTAVSAATSITSDFSPQAISSINMQYCQATFQGASGGPVDRVSRSGGVFTAHLGSSSTGDVIFSATMNSNAR